MILVIPTIPDHLHRWRAVPYEDDLGHGVRHVCDQCDDPTFRVYLPGSLRNRVLAAERKRRHREREEGIPGA